MKQRDLIISCICNYWDLIIIETWLLLRPDYYWNLIISYISHKRDLKSDSTWESVKPIQASKALSIKSNWKSGKKWKEWICYKILRSVKEWKDSNVKLVINWMLFPSWIKFKVLFSTPSQWRPCLVSPSWWRRGRCWTVCKHPLPLTRSTPGNNMPFLSKEESSVLGCPRVGWPPVVTLRSISHQQGWSQWGRRSRRHLSDLSMSDVQVLR